MRSGGETLVEAPVDAPPPDLPGFRIERETGRGGMGVVYLAHEEALDRAVAIKVIRGAAASAEELARFLREAGVAAGLQHPNSVQVYRVEGANAPPFIVLEYVPGLTLADKLAGT